MKGPFMTEPTPIMSTGLSFELLPKNQDAARLVMTWRNDDETSKNSFNQAEKSWPEFWQEFSTGYFSESQLPGFFVLQDGERVGVVGFQRVAAINGLQTAAVSINIAPGKRAKGLGSNVLKAVQGPLRAAGIQSLLAEIQSNNKASLKAFEKAGFRPLDQYKRKLSTGQEVSVDRLTVSLANSFYLPGSKRAVGEGHPCFAS